MARCPDILWTTEYIKHVLYFSIVKQGKSIRSSPDVHYFSIDNELVYENYYCDFGPLNLGCVYLYCKKLNDKVKQLLNKQTIVHYTSNDPKKKANAAFLLGCYGVLYLSLSPKDAIRPLLAQRQCYRSFQDATQGDSTFTISIIDCLQGIKKAYERGFFNFHDFDYEEYQRLDKIQGGDLNWIVPGKFLAFIGPVDLNLSLYHPPEMYINYFLENDVDIVMRLNKKQYNANVFTCVGITHYDLYFADGSCPPRHILLKFLAISENCNRGAIAVHCKAGLGRTGSLIGCYLIKHYRMSAREAISWMRICRPGSVIGQQQGWLEQLEPWLLKQGNLYRKRMYGDIDKMPVHKFGIYSMAEKALKHRPVVFKKSPSPPPPMQRKEHLLSAPSTRPHASKLREAPSKPPENEQNEWNMRTVRNTIKRNLKKQNCDRADSSSGTSRRSSGAGDLSIPSTSRTTSRSHLNAHSSTDKNSKTKAIVNNYSPVTIFTTSQAPVIKTISDAKKFLLKTSTYAEERQKQFKLNTENPQYSFGVPKYNTKCSTSENTNYSNYNTGAFACMNTSGCNTDTYTVDICIKTNQEEQGNEK